VIEEMNKRDYILLSNESDFSNAGSKIKYICKKHPDEGIQDTTLGHLKEGKGCKYCGRIISGNKRLIDLDKEYDKELAESKNFTYIDTIRENGKITICFICNNHKEFGIQHMSRTNMERDISGCKYCSGRELPEWYVMKMANEINPYIEFLEPYKNLTTRMKCFCKKHNHPVNRTIQEVLKGEGCYYCGLEKLSQQNSLSIEEYQKRVSNKNPNILVIEYNGMVKNAKFQCKLCGNEWESCAVSVNKCPNCERYYSGEKQISELLDSWGITYISQYRFDDCKDQRSLPFDFFLPNDNTCIEFDGEQHFKQKYGWTDIEQIKKHDNIKNEYCKTKSINLIRIPYWEQEDIKYVLFDNLVKCNVLEEITN
jgi:hypothetical protein